MSNFEELRWRLKVGFGVQAVVLAVALPLVWPWLGKCEWIAKISVSPMQVLYTTAALEITLAVYIWGVGNWSRFEPPRDASDSPASPAVGTPAGQGGAPAPAAGTPAAQQGGH